MAKNSNAREVSIQSIFSKLIKLDGNDTGFISQFMQMSLTYKMHIFKKRKHKHLQSTKR